VALALALYTNLLDELIKKKILNYFIKKGNTYDIALLDGAD